MDLLSEHQQFLFPSHPPFKKRRRRQGVSRTLADDGSATRLCAAGNHSPMPGVFVVIGARYPLLASFPFYWVSLSHLGFTCRDTFRVLFLVLISPRPWGTSPLHSVWLCPVIQCGRKSVLFPKRKQYSVFYLPLNPSIIWISDQASRKDKGYLGRDQGFFVQTGSCSESRSGAGTKKSWAAKTWRCCCTRLRNMAPGWPPSARDWLWIC